MKIIFQGAAGVVTGSMHLIESNGQRILLDCGMFQGRRRDAERINRQLPFEANSIDAVVLSHAHIDHSGNLPLLVKQGFRGPIYTTPATIDLCKSMLQDTGRIAESDTHFVNKTHPEDPPVQPIFTMEDVAKTLELFHPVAYHEEIQIAGKLTVKSFDAGHMLGSTSLLITGDGTRLIYSGDVGRPGLPIIRDPETMPAADYLIVESTYGGRLHSPLGDAAAKMEAIVNRTVKRGGKVIIPAFAVGRTQQIVLILHRLINENRIPKIPIYVDSPLAVNVTEAFRNHTECFDDATNKYLRNGEDPFGFDRLTYVRDVEESKKLNGRRDPMVVISASGMCEAGRVLHHLRNNIGESRNTVLLTGYQAENTLGRKIQDGWKDVRIFGLPVHVEAEVDSLDELSGHADSAELLRWMEPITPTLKKVFLVHGEPEQSAALAKSIGEKYHLDAHPVQKGESFELI